MALQCKKSYWNKVLFFYQSVKTRLIWSSSSEEIEMSVIKAFHGSLDSLPSPFVTGALLIELGVE